MTFLYHPVDVRFQMQRRFILHPEKKQTMRTFYSFFLAFGVFMALLWFLMTLAGWKLGISSLTIILFSLNVVLQVDLALLCLMELIFITLPPLDIPADKQPLYIQFLGVAYCFVPFLLPILAFVQERMRQNKM